MREDDAIVRFYRDDGTDARNRRLAEILAWDDARLESVHDYIQWLFPLAEPSAFNPDAPLVTGATVRAFQHDPVLRSRLEQSLTRMLMFYGLTRSTARGVTIEQAADFPAQSRNWLRAGNHNHLRLTRILTSLRLLGLVDHSRALYACLEQIAHEHPKAISPVTLTYWRQAAA